MNSFLGGIHLSEAPGFVPNIAWIIPILAGLSQWYSAKLMAGTQVSAAGEDNPMAASMKTMNIFMPIMSVVICISLPCGVGLYWVASSVIGAAMRLAVNKYMDKLDMNEIMKKNREKQNKKRAKKGLPPISENANRNTRNNYNKTIAELEAEAKKKNEPPKPSVKVDSTKYYEERGIKPGSIAAKARMVKEYNEKNQKK